MYFPSETLGTSLNSHCQPPTATVLPPSRLTCDGDASNEMGTCSTETCGCGPPPNYFLPDPRSVENFPTTTQLQRLIEKECHDKRKDWSGLIILPCTLIHELDQTSINFGPSPIDVCTYFNGQKSSAIKRLNLSLTEFPPPSDKTMAFKGGVWTKLKLMIE